MTEENGLHLNRKLQAEELERLRNGLRPAMGAALDPDVMEYVIVMVGNQHTIIHMEKELLDELDFHQTNGRQ